MPLVRIDVIEGRTPEELQSLADCIHQAVLEAFAAPERDRYQVIQQHRREHLIVLDTGLGIERTDRVVLVQITSQAREASEKTELYARLAELLEQRGVAAASDVVVSVVENTQVDWSFGFGRAQFLTGELSPRVPEPSIRTGRR
jgi:phenylpyruvate tautomerase PptA (4-oxalocrotonate tautomerase family)